LDLFKKPVDDGLLALLTQIERHLAKSRDDVMMIDEDGTRLCTEREFHQMLREGLIESMAG
jgi:hypothetical protein